MNLQGYNRYSYVKNNPLSFSDPTGENAALAAIPTALVAGGAVAIMATTPKGREMASELSRSLAAVASEPKLTPDEKLIISLASVYLKFRSFTNTLGDNKITAISPGEIDLTDPGIQVDGQASRPLVHADPIPSTPLPQEGITGTEAADVVQDESIEAQGQSGPMVHSTPASDSTELPTTYSATNGNSKQSTNEQHGYGIRRNGEMVKAGISGQGLNQNGTSPRANRQVNALNKAAGAEIYEAEILFGVATGTGAREAALTSDQQVADQNRETLDPNLHRRP